LDVFEAFAEMRRPSTLSELADAIGMPLSSCFALARTIESRGYLYTLRPRGPLYPTGRLLQMTRTIAEHDPIALRAAAPLAEVRDLCGETVVIGALTAADVVYIDVLESRQAIRYSPRAGDRRPIHANSIGKAILGAMSVKRRQLHLSNLKFERLTPWTFMTPEELEADILKGVRCGWQTNLRESVTDLTAIAVPLRINGDLLGISIAGPDHRMEPAKFEELSKALARAAQKIGDKPIGPSRL
jgi:DNA-binding IclR family transcriptional regulator